MPATYINLATTTLGSYQATVTFSSISQLYTDLLIKLSCRSYDSTGVQGNPSIRFNGDSASNYSSTLLYGTGSTAESARKTSETNWVDSFAENGSSSTANVFSNSEIYIPNYKNTSSRAMSSFNVVENGATTAFIAVIGARYTGTSAITQISITSASGTGFVAGSSFYLYGIKNS